MRYLLDTNIIILFLKGDEATIELLSTLARQSSESFAVSTVTQMEVWEGIYQTPNPQAAAQQYQAFFDEVTLWSFDSEVAKRCAKLRHDLRQQSIRTRDRGLDLQIAATALHHGLTLVTYNVQDYNDIVDLPLYER